MVRTSLTVSVLTVALGLAVTPVRAADYWQPPPYQPPPQQPIIIQQPAPEFAGNWYLRGLVGVGMTQASQLTFIPNAATAAAGFAFDKSAVSDSFFIGAGVGYEWNDWFRFEATAEYRAKSRIYATASYNVPTFALDTYEGSLKSWVFLANGFVDLGTWNCLTPFVGAGIGMANNTFADFSDVGVTTGGRGFGRNTSQWNLAWALYAGVGYSVTKNFKVDLTYRYLNLGSFKDTIDCVGGCGGSGPITYKFKDVSSHDIMLGFRWLCCDTAPPPPRYVYTPPPPPPPLQSKG